MKKLGLHEIRKEFLDFFREKEHLVHKSYSLVPKDDPSLLLIGAGMAPLKKYFTGEAKPPKNRMATCQKCIRTGDIDNVGKTDRHATFFEMLGNFSFGDYFKLEAMEWAWEFLHERMEIAKEDLWVTVYENDQEAFDLWRDEVHISEDRIIKLGKEDNFWELEVGPSGPCSEIYVDRGEEYGCGHKDCKPGCECDRFIEVWNLVFTQFDKDEEGIYHPLANPNIDTGMGLERLATVLEGANNIFEIGAIQDIISTIEKIAGYKYGQDSNKDESVRVITDHSRAMTFLVSDGVVPSNEGRGYVLRRLIRRAARHGKLLGVESIFLGQVVDEIIDSWKIEYEEIAEKRAEIKKIIRTEEEKFEETIDQGLSILDSYIKLMKENNTDILSGEDAFKLYDTYGFPLDLTKEILFEKGLGLDEEAFNKNMDRQREMARAARDSGDSGWAASGNINLYEDIETEFKGYELVELNATIEGIFSEDTSLDSLSEGEEGIILLDRTPFYAEGGGQVGDKGTIESEKGFLKVLDTQSTKKDHILHKVRVEKGSFNLEDRVYARVENPRREFIKRNHTATHLLHRALKDTLGEGVNQAGSVVDPNRLRFDFTYNEPVTACELEQIEKIVNEKIFASIDTNVVETSYDKAKSMGVVGLFEDSYGEEVRVMSIGDYSRELCGGVHVKNTSEIGAFKIIGESGVASGVRRIEAITSRAVYEHLKEVEADFGEIMNKVKANKTNVLSRIDDLILDLRESKKELESLKDKMAFSMTDDLLKEVEKIGGVNFLAKKLDNTDMNGLRNLGDELKAKLDTSVIVLAGVKDEKLSFIATVTKDLVGQGYNAGNIVRDVAKVTGGSGGGRPDMAQAGGKDISKVDEALEYARTLLS